ncbi:MAG: nitronate monooxygenase, partial [Deltaproteobacteria bacterium]|nr:nitronate monooxygenase [Deltaproteobacteria bacterium]
MNDFKLIALTLPGFGDPAVAIAASRAGGLGILDLSFTPINLASEALKNLARYSSDGSGLRLDSFDTDLLDYFSTGLPITISTVILTYPTTKEQVYSFQAQDCKVWLEVTSLDQLRHAEKWGVDGLIAKGQEAGGWVGEETTFILLQHLVNETSLPVYAQGWIGLHTVGAAYASGAAGAVLDSQLTLVKESRLPEYVKDVIRRMDGSETLRLNIENGHYCRIMNHPGAKAAKDLQKQIQSAEDKTLWREAIAEHVGWGSDKNNIWLLGQDAAFARSFAERFHTVGGVFQAIQSSLRQHIDTAKEHKPFREQSPMAISHGTRYPIVQGPMTRVSDNAEFAYEVAKGGGLPFLALALMRAPQVEQLLQETQKQLAHLPWGVGLLGFVPLELRQEQLEVIRKYKPPFAIIAGGRPDQASQLEQDGITAYLHVPSPGLLGLFLQDGTRRFIFEGREAGGHIGPRTSFILWESMVQTLI